MNCGLSLSKHDITELRHTFDKRNTFVYTSIDLNQK